MEDWFQRWFDGDYAELYAHRDAAEAAGAVGTALALAPELAEGPVLDLGCGTGRHLEALRTRNPMAFGLDLSSHLLSLAPECLRGWLLQGDMRSLPVRSRALQGICLWFTPFGYFPDDENRALLGGLAACLRPGGVLWLDYLNAPQVRATLEPGPERIERGGIAATIHRRLEGSRVVKRMRIQRTSTGESREAVESVRLYDPPELERIAAAAGLSLRTSLGGYAGEPYGSGSERWIGIFAKA